MMTKGVILDRRRGNSAGEPPPPVDNSVCFRAPVVDTERKQCPPSHRAGARAPVADNPAVQTQSQSSKTGGNMDSAAQDLTGHASIFNGLTGSTLSLRKKRVGGL